MKKLEKLTQKLNTDSFSAVTIIDNDTDEKVCTNKLSETILAEFDTAELFFDSLLDNGHSNITVQEMRKNGNNFKKIDIPFTLSPEVETPVAPAMQTMAVNQFEPKKKKKKKKNNMYGLGGAEILQLNTKASQVDSLVADKIELKAENKRLADKIDDLKEKIEELKTEALEKRLEKQNNDSRNNLIATGLKQAPVIAAALGISIPNAGLSAPDENNLSEVQNALLQQIKETDDSLNQYIINILTRIAQKNEGDTFEPDFVQLLTKYNLI